MTHALPDALDLMVVCVEAGLGLNAAILKVSQEISLASPVLAGELRQVNNEMKAGINRIDALRNLAARTGVADVKSLVAVLVQTDRLGTSVAQSLRAQFVTLKTQIDATGAGGYARELTAEERAAQQAELNEVIGGMDVVITTAQVPGRKPPVLVTADAVARMKPGSVIVDMASETYDEGFSITYARPRTSCTSARCPTTTRSVSAVYGNGNRSLRYAPPTEDQARCPDTRTGFSRSTKARRRVR